MMVKFLIPPLVICLVLLVTTLIFRSDILPYNVLIPAFSVLTVVTHGVVLMVRKMRSKLFGPLDREWFGTVPNLSLLLLAINYGLGFFLLDGATIWLKAAYVATAVVVLAVIALSHLTADVLAKPVEFDRYMIPVAAPQAKLLTSTGRNIIYRMRLACVLSSLGLLAVIGWWGYAAEIAGFAFFLQVAYLYMLLQLKHLLLVERKYRQNTLRRTGSAYWKLFQPVFMLYYSRPAGKDILLLQSWTKRLSSLSVPFITLVREKAHFNRLIKAGATNVVLADSMDMIEPFVSKSLKAVITLNNDAKNAQIVRYDHVRQINVVPPKAFANVPFPNSFGMYSDLLFSDRETAHKALAAGISASITVIDSANTCSRPTHARDFPWAAGPILTIGYLLSAPNGDWSLAARSCKAAIASIQSRLKPTTLIVRADTVGKADKNSESTFSEIAATIEQFPPGPGNRTTFLTAKQMSLDAVINQSDVLLCDLSRLNDDLLVLGKPIIATDIFGLSDGPDAIPVAAKACYLLEPYLTNFDVVLQDINDTDSLKVKRDNLIAALDIGIETLPVDEALRRLVG